MEAKSNRERSLKNNERNVLSALLLLTVVGVTTTLVSHQWAHHLNDDDKLGKVVVNVGLFRMQMSVCNDSGCSNYGAPHVFDDWMMPLTGVCSESHASFAGELGPWARECWWCVTIA